MTEEIYKNGDIYYVKTLLGEIKMFDKDDNEINWTPTQNLGDKVIFYNQAYINEQLKRLEQENKELKETIEAFKTMATVPTRMYNECERERCRYGRALEEIRELAKNGNAIDGIRLKIIDKINEVLK